LPLLCLLVTPKLQSLIVATVSKERGVKLILRLLWDCERETPVLTISCYAAEVGAHQRNA